MAGLRSTLYCLPDEKIRGSLEEILAILDDSDIGHFVDVDLEFLDTVRKAR